MKLGVILVTICAFLVAGVRSYNRPFFCDYGIEGNEENTGILLDCIGDNYPEAWLNVLSVCYREGYGVSDGTWRDQYRHVCDTQRNEENDDKYLDCLTIRGRRALIDAGISRRVAGRAFSDGMRCVEEKLGSRR